jgi:transcriptional regulator with XRE-family HTH domain
MSFTHGTTTGYSVHRCRCDACMGRWRQYQNRYRRDVREGRPRTVPAAEARRWVAHLIANGMTQHQIAAAAGVDFRTVYGVSRRKSKRIRSSSAEKILGVTPDDRPAGSHAPAGEALRLIEAMREAGVPMKTIAGPLRVTAPSRIKHQQRVSDRTRRKLIVAYRHLASLGLVDASLLEEVNA